MPLAAALVALAAVHGAAGAGDPYFPRQGNGGYDVRHYDLRVQMAAGRVAGANTVTAVAQSALSRFDLDLHGLRVRGVAVDGHPAAYSRSGGELRIVPRRPLRRGARFRVRVRYGGTPRPTTDLPALGPYGFTRTRDGAVEADEPNGAASWMPVSDHPSDKASWTMRITVPRGLGVVANGQLRARRRHGRTTTFVWEERAPMATYLATADVGHWVLRRGRTPGGIPETVAVDPSLGRMHGERAVDWFFDVTAEATDLWTRTFGPYPFDSTGAIADRVPGGPLAVALETQTRPLYAGVVDDWVIAHELAHQWFGDSVSLRRWRDTWLNEGFARFAEYLWAQHKGRGTAHEIFRGEYATRASDPLWHVKVADPGRNRLFDQAVYRRGAMTLQALREKVGDDTFFRILRTWAARHRRGNATTPQFIRLAERLSGRDLRAFFHVWLETRRKPRAW